MSASPDINPGAGSHARQLIELPGGIFRMGTDRTNGFPADGEGPSRNVELDAFSIDAYTVTNADFAAFIDSTGYKTEAENFGWSFVFHLHVSPEAKKAREMQPVPGLGWWFGVENAYWNSPEGRGSTIEGRENYPVVHVSWNDAQAYCQWAGCRLPSEAEWEYAARGGTSNQDFPWGDELEKDERHHCNVWQGIFPTENTAEDGFHSTAPVDAFEANGYGLFNVCGNVWEWCADWFSPEIHRRAGDSVQLNPGGPSGGVNRVTRGGSFLCHESYCNRYRLPARSSNTPDSSSSNTGFRVARSRKA